MSESHELRHRDVTASVGQSTNEKTENGGINGVVKEKSETASDDVSVHKCAQIEDRCENCCIPCLVSYNPLPPNPTCGEKLFDMFRLPPHGLLASYVQFAVVCLQLWIVLYSLTHAEALPGGNFFSLLMLFIFCVIGGYVISFVNLPPLLGMLIVGLMLRNVPGIKYVGEHINVKWSGALRKIALTVILTRAGLGLDIVKLKKLSWAVLRLAFLPSAAEIITASIVSKFLLGFPWFWSFMLGCIMGALSPAVTVPSLVSLQDRRYGVNKGIPTMLLAAGGLDNVLCVTGFSVFFGIIFSDGEIVVTIFKGPIGVCVGIAYGFIAGIFLWYIPAKDSSNPTFYRSLMLLCAGLIAIFGSSEVGLSGAGPLGCLTTATVAAYRWRKERVPGQTDEVSGVIALTWLIVQHFLFGLIGSAVDVNHIQSNTAGLGIATLAIGLFVRSIVSFNVTMGTGFNLKERLFVTLTWLSKATVQAAIGGLALDKVLESETPDENDVKYATDILTISVLAIIICAPIGATLMAVLGPRFLEKGDEEEVEVKVNKDITKAIEVEQKVEMVKETEEEPVEEVVIERPVENLKFKSELSLTLQNLAAKLEEKEPVLKDEPLDQAKGFDNPAFVEADVDLSVEDSNTDVYTEPVDITQDNNIKSTDIDSISAEINVENTNANEINGNVIEAVNSNIPEVNDDAVAQIVSPVVDNEDDRLVDVLDNNKDIIEGNSNQSADDKVDDVHVDGASAATDGDDKDGKYITIVQIPPISGSDAQLNQ